MNDLMSLGMHRLWKKRFVEIMDIKENEIKNVKIAKLALSSVEGNAFMNKFDDKKTSNYGDARIFKDNSENFEKVPVKTLDQTLYNDTNENFKDKR